jgi:hypothetical protein
MAVRLRSWLLVQPWAASLVFYPTDSNEPAVIRRRKNIPSYYLLIRSLKARALGPSVRTNNTYLFWRPGGIFGQRRYYYRYSANREAFATTGSGKEAAREL